MNNNTDSKAAQQFDQERHSENCQTPKIELSLGNSERLKSAGHFHRNVRPDAPLASGKKNR